MRRVEWIGCKGPKDDDMIRFRLSAGLYTEEEARQINAAEVLIKPMIRQYGSTRRVKTKDDVAGYSKEYVWGEFNFVVEMEDIDADRMFSKDPDEAQFRDLDNPDHDDRVPVVPWTYVTKKLWDIMEAAKNGPQLVQVGVQNAGTSRQVSQILSKIDEANQDNRDRREWEKSRGR